MEKIVAGVKRVILLIVILSLFAGFFGSVSANPDSKVFEVDNVLLKLIVKQGESVSKTIKVTNTDSIQRDFKLAGNMNFFSINEQEFSLGSGESKSLEINFEAENQPGVYVGRLLISSSKEELKIPVILEVETKEVLFDSSINVPLDYGEVYIGGSLAVENKIFNLENIGLKSVDITYSVKDFNGNTIFSEKENIAVENQILTTKIISIPENTNAGDYVFYVVIEYANSVGTSSYFFKITEEQGVLGSMNFFDSFGSWIFVIILFAVVIFFIVFTKQRDNLFLELEKQHKTEMREEIERINAEKVKISRLKDERRKKELKKLMEKKKKRLKVIKIIYKERVKTFKKLKKQKKKNEIEEKLEQWKKQGYNVNEFLVKTRGKKQGLKDIGVEIKSYKKQGYKL
ncbi:MAG: hypothetical protein Q8N63_07155 [Nanoarchaeota archaeon]|nr:hypothetical protein [Nanoarchaeota archaeon]